MFILHKLQDYVTLLICETEIMDSFRFNSRIVAFIILFNISVITIINAGLKLILIFFINRFLILIKPFSFNLRLSRIKSYTRNVDSESLQQRDYRLFLEILFILLFRTLFEGRFLKCRRFLWYLWVLKLISNVDITISNKTTVGIITKWQMSTLLNVCRW